MKKVTVRKRCGKCKEGEMKSTGVVFTSNPPQYQHQCNNDKCGIKVSMLKSYPYEYIKYTKKELEEKWEE